VSMSDGSVVRARTVVVATGVDYRRLEVPELERLVGRGVFYGAAVAEAPSMAGEDVFVVGGGNSAGQAALHLARFARHVTLLVRSPTLAASMSDYLISQLEATRNVSIRYRTEVRGGREADACLAGVVVGDPDGGPAEELPAAGLFVLIGSVPRTSWLPAEVRRDAAGFVHTGPDRDGGGDPGTQMRLPLETGVPGVFAIGDVRAGSIKRVATAVGDGATVISLIHGYLAAHAR
jgi:thioredoxin reductase (NADPH)